MSILVVGSVAFDTLTTPTGKAEKILGGAATHFALAASYFTDVRVVGVVGRDFTPENEAILTRRGIDTTGIEHADGLSFHWTGSYTGAMNEATTLGTDLNVFADFSPKIPASLRGHRLPLPRQHRPRPPAPRPSRPCRTSSSSAATP